MIHSDLCGLIGTSSHSGYKYFIIYIDDWSRYIWVYFLKTKSADEISSRFQEFQALLQTQCPQARIQRFRSDNGSGEYNNTIFQNVFKEHGIIYEPSTPYTQHQNGVSERTIRSINDMARSMLHDSQLPEVFWSEAVNTAVYIRNRSPTRGLSTVNSPSGGLSGRLLTPYECYSGKCPSLGHIRPFGCNVFLTRRGLNMRAKASGMLCLDM